MFYMKEQNIKEQLFNKLKDEHAFWSFEDPVMAQISDELLIEKVLIHLDIQEINQLFVLYPKSKIKKVWINNIIPLEPQYHSYNMLFAAVYFDIKDPGRYIKRKVKQHFKAFTE
jgi:hypothetical protein